MEALQKQIHQLQSRLEESERWNNSLQVRLNEALPRGGGVGCSEDSTDGIRDASIDSDVNFALTKVQEVT